MISPGTPGPLRLPGLLLSGVLLLLLGTGPGCRRASPTPGAAFAFRPDTLDQDRAYHEVEAFVAIHPRDAGTDGARRAAEYLLRRLTHIGLDARMDVFEQPAPGGTTTFRNVIASIPGDERLIILGSHFDTKTGIGADFEGANDSGSSTGLLLELAQVLSAHIESTYAGPEIQFVFFDGEEARVRYGPTDGFHGSRHYAKQLETDGKDQHVLAVIILDMVGDQDLTVTLPRNSSSHLLSAVLAAAHAEGVRDRFALHPGAFGDDHVPFLELGVPAVDIIDFRFGSAPDRNDYWHTLEDTMDKVSPVSLGSVGRVAIRVINSLL